MVASGWDAPESKRVSRRKQFLLATDGKCLCWGQGSARALVPGVAPAKECGRLKVVRSRRSSSVGRRRTKNPAPAASGFPRRYFLALILAPVAVEGARIRLASHR